MSTNIPNGYHLAYGPSGDPYLAKDDTAPAPWSASAPVPPTYAPTSIPTAPTNPSTDTPSYPSNPAPVAGDSNTILTDAIPTVSQNPSVDASFRPVDPAVTAAVKVDEEMAVAEANENAVPDKLDALNHDTSLIDQLVGKQLVALNDWANSHPDAPLAGSVRAKLNGLANEYLANPPLGSPVDGRLDGLLANDINATKDTPYIRSVADPRFDGAANDYNDAKADPSFNPAVRPDSLSTADQERLRANFFAAEATKDS